jgi:EpsG-like putative glucosyltransferase
MVMALWLSFLSVFSGTRYYTGCDFTGYLHRYENIVPLLTFEKAAFVLDEPGFNLLALGLFGFGLDFMWLNVASAVIFFLCFGIFANRHPAPLMLLTLSFPILIIQLSMSGLRQALATAFLMLAFNAFSDNKRVWVAFWIVIAAQFHQTAILLLPLAFIAGREISVVRILGAVVILGPFAGLFLSDRLDLYSDRYVEQIYGSQSSSGAALRLGLLLITASIFEMYKTRIKALFPKYYQLMRIFSLASFALIPVFLISSVAVHRLIYYILPVNLFTLACLPYAMFPRNQWQIGKLLPLALYFSYIAIWFAFSRHANICYTPYESYLLN